MKYKIAVCDDSETDQAYVIGFLNTWAQQNDRVVEVHSFVSAEQFLFQYADEKDYHVLILDIEMGMTSGLDVCRELLGINPRTNVVYLTAYSNYSLDAWSTGASGFMLKPITSEGVLAQLRNLRYPFFTGGEGL